MALGSERFLDRLRSLGDQAHREPRRERRLFRGLDLARVIEAVCSRYGVDRGQLAPWLPLVGPHCPRLPGEAPYRGTLTSSADPCLSRPESVPNLSARFAALLQSESNTRRDLLALEPPLA